MTTTNQTLETLSVDQLAPVTGGGFGTTIGGLFGAKGQKWGAMADNIFGMFKGMGGGGGGGGGGSSGGGGGGGGFSGMLGNLGKLFGGFGGGSSGSSGSSAAPADTGGGGE
jgi:hypothetical protein